MMNVDGPRTFIRISDDDGVVAYVGSSKGLREAISAARLLAAAPDLLRLVERAECAYSFDTVELKKDIQTVLKRIFREE